MEHLSGTVRGVVKAVPGGLAIAAIAVALSDVVADVADAADADDVDKDGVSVLMVIVVVVVAVVVGCVVFT